MILLAAGLLLPRVSMAGEGYDAGYEWAEENGVADESECDSHSPSFNDGCEDYAREQEDEDFSSRYPSIYIPNPAAIAAAQRAEAEARVKAAKAAAKRAVDQKVMRDPRFWTLFVLTFVFMAASNAQSKRWKSALLYLASVGSLAAMIAVITSIR